MTKPAGDALFSVAEAHALARQISDLHPLKFTQDDKGMSLLFANTFQNQCRYNVTAKEWFCYDGTAWKADPGGMHVAKCAKLFADALTVFALSLADGPDKTSFLKLAAHYGQLRYRETLIKDARDVHFMEQGSLDQNTALFNCKNGTFNLETGIFQPHRASDLLSKCSGVVYDPHAKSPLFARFIGDVLQQDTALIDYVQRVMGYMLTGSASLETCWILYGATTRNGKSTLIETIAHMMGEYAMATQPQTLAQRQNKDTRQASGDIARLDGCRFLNASEPPKRMIFDTALLKTLLGRDAITARHLYEREFQFYPCFSLFINTNHLPLIQDDTLFTSGRINVIPFNRHFEPNEQDRGLKNRLARAENISGIFNWCLEGLAKYKQSGAEPPPAVVTATQRYRENSDKIGRFISDCLIPADQNSPAGVIYEQYRKWCSDSGQGCESKGAFFEEMRSRGLLSARGTVDGKTVKNIVRGYELAS